MQKELIYSMMNGFVVNDTVSIPDRTIIEDEFAEGKECCQLYKNVYQARLNLCEKLGESENEDIETIVSCMERISKLLAMKMYDYGKSGYGA